MALRRRVGILTLIASATAGAQEVRTWGPPTWPLERLGFYDAVHTGADGSQYSYVEQSGPSGRLVGVSARLNVPGNTNWSVWSWTPSEGAVRIGLFDAAHTSSLGDQYSTLNNIDVGDRVSGTAGTFLGAARLGSTAWTWAPGEGTTALELTDPEHTSSLGWRITVANNVSDEGWITGTARRFEGLADRGLTPWAWSSAGGMITAGLTDPEHTRADGYRRSDPKMFFDGRFSGNARRYAGMADAGLSGWIWNARGDGEVTRLGLADPEHTRPDGYRSTDLDLLGSIGAGAALGRSSRFLGNADGGRTVWHWSPDQGYTVLGFVDSAHTRSDGFRLSSLSWDRTSRTAFGWSQRFLGAQDGGYSVYTWTEAGGLSRRGFFDAAHTRDDGFQESSMFQVGRGLFIGTSTRFHGHNPAGESAWTWTPDAGLVAVEGLTDDEHTGPQGQHSAAVSKFTPDYTSGTSVRYPQGHSAWVRPASGGIIRLGLTDARHTSESGVRESLTLGSRQTTRILGRSRRYSGTAEIGESLWIYDPADASFHTLVFSVGPNGEANTRVSFVSPEGVVCGSFFAYQPDASWTLHAFIWSAARGMADLGALPDGGVLSAGLTNLDEAQFISGADPWDGAGPAWIVGAATPAGHTGAAAFALLPPPCPADFNGDGRADAADFAAFQDAFAAGSPGADWNGDGFIDFFDQSAFFDTLDAGC